MRLIQKFLDRHGPELLHYIEAVGPPDTCPPVDADHAAKVAARTTAVLQFVDRVLDDWRRLPDSVLTAPDVPGERAFWSALYGLEEVAENQHLAGAWPYAKTLKEGLLEDRERFLAKAPLPFGAFATRPGEWDVPPADLDPERDADVLAAWDPPE